jgi:ATP-dependent DNA ligase
MLARSGRLPAHGDFAYELKWDGFRALVSTERGFVCAAGAAGT